MSAAPADSAEQQQQEALLGCLRLRGLPFTAGQSQLLEWFEGFDVLDAVITTTDGKPNGQAFVLLAKEEAARAQLELNNKYMGKRFIEVFTSTTTDMETARRMCAEQQRAALAANSSGGGGQRASRQHHQSQSAASNTLYIIRLRGLPFSATATDVRSFLAPIELPEGLGSIQLARHPDLRPTGEAYVHLHSEADVMQAIKKHKQVMGKRYIEVFPSCLAELQQAMLLPKPGYPADALPGHNVLGMPSNNPVAQAAWLAQQQQLMQLQQHVQLQAAAQQKMLASVQHQQHQQHQRQQVLQAQAQLHQLQAQLQHMQLHSSPQQQQQQHEMLIAMPGGFGAAQQQHQQQQQQRQQQQQATYAMGGGMGSPAVSLTSAVNMGSMASSTTTLGTTGANNSSSSMMMSLQGFQAGLGCMPGGSGMATAGGLAATAAAAAAATCSPSPLDVQYVPYFSSGTSGQQLDALLLQDQQVQQLSAGQHHHQQRHPAGLMMSPSRQAALLSNLHSNHSGSHLTGHHSAFGVVELLSSASNNALDSNNNNNNNSTALQLDSRGGGGGGGACGGFGAPGQGMSPANTAALQMYGSGCLPPATANMYL